jgi:hypothetical protein
MIRNKPTGGRRFEGGCRFSEKIMRRRQAKAKWRCNLKIISLQLAIHQRISMQSTDIIG